MDKQNCQDKTTHSEIPLQGGKLVRSEDLRGDLQGEPEWFQPTETKHDAEARRDVWSIQGDFIYHHHNDPRVQLHMPKEETFPVPLKYMDVMRSTNTALDVAQEKRINDCWNVADNRVCQIRGQDSRSSIYCKKLPKWYMWSGSRHDKNTSNHKTCELVAPSVVQKWEKPLRREKSKNGALTSSIGKMVNLKNRQKRKAAMPCKKGTKKHLELRKLKRRVMNSARFQKQSMRTSWKLTNPRDNVCKHLYLKIAKIASQTKDTIQWVITTWCSSLFLFRKRQNPDAKSAVYRE